MTRKLSMGLEGISRFSYCLLIFILGAETSVAQAGLELLDSGGPPSSPSEHVRQALCLGHLPRSTEDWFIVVVFAPCEDSD